MRHTNRMVFVFAGFVLSIVFIVFTSTNTAVYADVASPEPKVYTQPNGKVISVTLKGDEFLGWTEDDAGNLIIYDKDKGGFCFAVWNDDGVVSTGELVGGSGGILAPAPRQKGGNIPRRTREKAEKTREESALTLPQAGIDLGDIAEELDFDSNAPPIPAPVSSLKRDLLIIHVTWTDRTGFETKPKLTGTQINNFVFNPLTKSVNDYYRELIGTPQDIIMPAAVSIPLDGYPGIIEVTLAGQHTDPKNDTTARRDLMVRAVTQACAEGRIDFSGFDKNGNGTVETTELSIGILVDGFNSSAYPAGSPGFWGVSTNATPAPSATNGKKLSGYFGMGTYNDDTGAMPQDLMGIGTICHEMGHSGYGFDDTYDYGTLTGSNTANGIGYWSLMDRGSHGYRVGERDGLTPPYVDAYNLVRYGFVTPGTFVGGVPTTISSHNQIYISRSNVSDKQYFLIQQRKYDSIANYDQGGFDRLSPYGSKNPNTGGVLIYHIDENVSLTRINDKPSHMYVSIEEAHGVTQNLQQTALNKNYGDINDLWGTTEQTFNHSSDPSSAYYGAFTNDLVPPTQNTPSDISIENIAWDSTTKTTTLEMSPLPTYSVGLSESGTYTFPAQTEGYNPITPVNITVTNTGNQPTGALGVALSGTNSGSFTLSTATIGSIATSNNSAFTIKPNDGLIAGTYAAIVTVSGGNGITASFNIRFTVNPPPTYTVSISPASYAFPSAIVGYAAQAESTFTITNTGTGQITGLSASADDICFEITTPLSATTLNTGQQATVGVHPKTGLAISNSYSGTLTIAANNGVSRQAGLTFQVNPLTPVISITSQPSATTNVTAGNISGSLSVSATVTESATLSYQWYRSTNGTNTAGTAESGATNDSFTIPTALTAGTYYYFCEVRATGGAASVRSDIATVIVAAAPVYSISLNRTGTHEFTAQPEGYSPITPVSVTITNTGNQPTGALVIALSGANDSSFTLSKTSIIDISPTAGSNTDSFTVAPNDGLAAGTYTAIVTASGANVASRSFNVSFTVNAAIVSISPTSKVFASAAEGYSQQTAQVFTITNDTAQTITNLTANLDNADFEISTALSPSTVGQGNNATVQVRPVTGLTADTAPYTGTLTVRWDTDNGTGLNAALSFTVTNAPLAFVPVTNITNVPSSVTVRRNLSLTGTVVPSNTTNNTIQWSVKSANGTGATITGNTFYASSSGTAIVTATVINGASPSTHYTKDFNITVNSQSSGSSSNYLSIYAETGGRITQGTSGDYQQGEDINISARANSGYVFDRWASSDGGSFTNRYNESTRFNMPDNSTTVTARFSYQGSSGSSTSQSQYTDAYISPSYTHYNRNSISDLSIRLYPGSYTFGSLRHGNYTLVRNSDYRVNGDNYIFSTSFLSGLYIGDNRIVFDMSGGSNPTLTVSITDTQSVAPVTAPTQAPVYITPEPAPTISIAAAPPAVYFQPPAIDEKNSSYPVLTVELNGKKINYSGQQAVVKNNRPFLPVRETFVALGYTVEWNQSTKTATIKKGQTILTITNGDIYFTMHGFPYLIGDFPAQMLNGCLMAPSLDILDKLGYRAYRDENNVVHIF